MHAVVAGSGIAGLFAALRLADSGIEVTIVTKQRPTDSSTNWAQGGIAAILDRTDGEGRQQHIEDTLTAGAGICDEEVVRLVVEEAGDRIRDLLAMGVQFQRQGEDFHLLREGGHSARRILHAKDATGKEIERALSERAASHELVTLMPNTLAVDLIQTTHGSPEKGISGIWCLDLDSGEMLTLEADALILATGGAGQLWGRTTNPSVATGDGMAMANRAGAKCRDMAFIQFHPTALALEGDRPFLITEALRGEGGVLLDEEGINSYRLEGGNPEDYSFTLNHSTMGSLATRDVVARACDQVMKEKGEPYVWLLTEHLDFDHLNQEFPNIAQRLERNGLKIGPDPIPVAPAAHYMVGGIAVDLEGRALSKSDQIIPGLFAIGEVACTGMHGGNRLASNSLLEAVVFAQRASSAIIAEGRECSRGAPDWRAEGLDDLVEHLPLVNDLEMLRSTMIDEVGLVRRNSRLNRAVRRIDLLNQEVDLIWRNSLPTRELIELRNMVEVASLVADDARNRVENIGLHYNADLE